MLGIEQSELIKNEQEHIHNEEKEHKKGEFYVVEDDNSMNEFSDSQSAITKSDNRSHGVKAAVSQFEGSLNGDDEATADGQKEPFLTVPKFGNNLSVEPRSSSPSEAVKSNRQKSLLVGQQRKSALTTTN